MPLLHQAGAAVFLVLLTLALQCASVAALIVGIRSVPQREIHQVHVFQSAALVMQTTIAVIVLHGIVILLWASCYRWLCLRSWESVLLLGWYLRDGRIRRRCPPAGMPVLGPLEGMIGMLMAGVTVGLLFTAVTHLVDGESR
jgi:hypothetical protein